MTKKMSPNRQESCHYNDKNKVNGMTKMKIMVCYTIIKDTDQDTIEWGEEIIGLNFR